MITMPLTCLAVMAASASPFGSGPQPPGEEWRFVLPAPGDSFEHPPFRTLVLSREKPDDVSEQVAYRGTTRRYAQIRYGIPGSVRLTVVLDEVGPSDADLYVDANRDRRIDARDRVVGTAGDSSGERVWRLPVDVVMVEGPVRKTTPRAVVFRLGRAGRTLAYAAAGYLEGTVTLAAQPRAARRMDGDGNGLLTDAQDRLWIDLDGDGRWDAMAEQFLYATVLNLNGARYVVRSDPLGSRLALEPLLGTGSVRLALAQDTSADVHATLVGRDGSAFGVSANEGATVPIGDYRLSTVSATLGDPNGGQSWSYFFYDRGGRGEPKWYSLAKDEQLVIDPIGKLTMELEVADKAKTVKAGEDVSLQPLLYTGDGLLISVAYRGTPASPVAQEILGALTTLTSTDGQTLGTAHSGFA
jgi:hypothetical protein